MLSGSVTHHLESGEQIRLEAGELLFMNRFVRHSIDPCGAEDVALNFIVQPQVFDFALENGGPGKRIGALPAGRAAHGGKRRAVSLFPHSGMPQRSIPFCKA